MRQREDKTKDEIVFEMNEEKTAIFHSSSATLERFLERDRFLCNPCIERRF
jgi:hypothetical protein